MIDEHALASDVGLTPTFEMSSDFGFVLYGAQLKVEYLSWAT
jgi:hypothetical protein